MAPPGVTAAARSHTRWTLPTPWRRWATLAVGVAVALLGAAALRAIVTELRVHDIAAALTAIPPGRLALALALTVASYLLLTCYDIIGLAVIGRPQHRRIGMAGGLLAHALGYNLGLPWLTANAARYRIYRRVGLTMADVVRVGAIASLALWSSVAGLAGIAMLIDTHAIGTTLLGGALLLAAGAGPLLRAAGVQQIGHGAARLPLPGARAMAGLGSAAVAELITAAAALFVLLPGETWAAFPLFFLAYALAIVAAAISHVPGGIGVFEAVVLAAHPADRPGVLAALIVYRLVYYLLPLAIAGTAIAVREARGVGRMVRPMTWFATRTGRLIAPRATALLVFTCGVVLLASGALPGVGSRLGRLDNVLPLPFIEGAHLAGSLVGTALLLVTPALNARLKSGWLVARPLLLAGAIFSLGKGLDYEEASLQLAVLALLQVARRSFYRRGGVASEPLEARWLLAAAGAVALSIGAGLAAYRGVPYSDDLWWRFALEGDAPRFLRATFAAGVLLAAAALWLLFLGRAPRADATALAPEVAARALATAPRTDANLAFTGDKRFIVADAGDAFVMYGVRGRTWVAMGDPVGPVARWDELAWSLRRACDAAGARLCFYQVSGAMLPILVDLGMNVMKYGEEAHVALADFSLAGRDAKDFRHALRRADAAGLTFDVVPAESVAATIDELRAISDAWLAGERGREKSFSLGPFDPAYLCRFPVAVIRREGRAIAFANIWTATAGGEMSVDLMRHLPGQPSGTMDMMFVRLFEWGRGQGYHRFNLGVAPLSGMPHGDLAPFWAKVGRLLFERGGRLYRFQGLRAFKAKFRPTWHPRYIGQPRGPAAIPALLGLAALVNRGG